MVHLQAQRGARLDHDALDLEARARVDRVVPAPGPMHLAVQRVLGASALAQLRDDLLDLLAAAAVSHHHRIGRLHHHQVLDAHHAHQPPARVHQRVAAVLGDHVADAGVAVFVLARHLPDRLPGAQVVPARAQRHHADVELAARAALHHRVVHRFRRHRRELRLARPHELRIALARRPGRLHRLGDVGTEGLQRLHPHRGAQHEHAAVPEVAALGQVALGSRQVRLLDELRHPRRAQLRQRADVAVAGLRRVGRDAQDHHQAVGRQPHRLAQRLRIRRLVGHRLVRRRHHQHRILTALERLQRRQRQRRRGVAPGRLQHHRRGHLAHLAQLVQRQEAVLLVAHHQRCGRRDVRRRQPRQAQRRFLEQAAVAVAQHQELLRIARARQRPQPRAAAAGHDHRLHDDGRRRGLAHG